MFEPCVVLDLDLALLVVGLMLPNVHDLVLPCRVILDIALLSMVGLAQPGVCVLAAMAGWWPHYCAVPLGHGGRVQKKIQSGPAQS